MKQIALHIHNIRKHIFQLLKVKFRKIAVFFHLTSKIYRYELHWGKKYLSNSLKILKISILRLNYYPRHTFIQTAFSYKGNCQIFTLSSKLYRTAELRMSLLQESQH